MTLLIESSSGIDRLNCLRSYIDLYYEPGQSESTVISGLHYLLDTSGFVPNKTEQTSDTLKFLKALSYALYDVDEIISNLAELLDIDKCPPQFLEYLGHMIGWTYIGGDVTAWRAQLRQAVYLYKQKGTKESLINALSYVFPKSYSSFDPRTSVKESYESYFPFLLYYILKTESNVCQDYYTLIEFLKNGQKNSDLVYNISNIHDYNVRFAVDAILEELDRKFKFIKINGVHYTETEHYQSLQEGFTGWIKNGVGVTGKGYESRVTAIVAIPPWENQRFYDTSFLSLEVLDELRKILTGCNSGRNYGVSESAADSLIDYIKEKTGIGTSDEVFYFGYNNKFKFFTSSLEEPFNKGNLLTSGTSEQLSVLDYWNSRSSNIFVVLETSAMDFDLLGANALTPDRISNISITMAEFLPFHALGRLILKLSIDDAYYGYVESISFDLYKTLTESNTTLLPSLKTQAWLGTSGVGDYLSSVDLKYAKESGRYLMKPNTSFWEEYGGIDIDRKATRRRNFRYVVSGEGYNFGGKAIPTPTYFYTSSLGSLRNTSQYIPLGFNFSGQHFISPLSVALSGVYDTSNSPVVESNTISFAAPSSTFMGIPVSSVMLFMGVDDNASGSLYSPRAVLATGSFYKAIVDYLLRRGQSDSTYLRFDLDFIEGISFRDLFNLWIDSYRLFEGNINGNSFHSLNHAFGPLVFNYNFEFSGIAGNNETSGQFAYKGESEKLDSPEYAFIFGSNGITPGHSYRTHDNQLREITRKGLVWRNGWGSYLSKLDFDEQNKVFFANKSQLSGIEVIAKENTTTVIVADMSSVPVTGCHREQLADISGITFFGGKDNIPVEDQVKIRLPFVRNEFLVRNPRFFNRPTDENLLSNSQTSSVSYWKLIGSVTPLQLSGITSINSKDIEGSYRALKFVDSTVGFSSLNGARAISDHIHNLIPGDFYQISSNGYAPDASGAIGYFLYNNERNRYYDFYNSTWVTSASGSYRASAINGNVADWVPVVPPVIKIDPTFDISDSYNLGVGISASGSTKSAFLRDVFLTKTNENTLLSNRTFECVIKVNSQSYSSISGKGLNRFRVRVYTPDRPYLCDYNKSDRFIFDFKRNRWMLLEKGKYNTYYKEFVLEDGETEIKFNVHTLNEYGPLDLKTRKLLMEPRYLNVHGMHSAYYIEIQPIFEYWNVSNDLYRPSVRFEYVKLRDLKYGSVNTNYTKEEANALMAVFTIFKDTVISRNSAISESFGVGSDGGSREVYLEQYGGTYSNANSGGLTIYEI
jgi:phage tail-like protein